MTYLGISMVTKVEALIQHAKFSSDTLMGFFDAAPKVLVEIEACPGLQWLARPTMRFVEVPTPERVDLANAGRTIHFLTAASSALHSRLRAPLAASPLSLGPMAQQWRPSDTVIPEFFAFQA